MNTSATPNTILVTTDASHLGNEALAHGASLARALHAKLTVLYIHPDPLPTVAEAYIYLPRDVAEQEEQMERVRADLARRVPGARLRIELAAGRLVPRLILEVAREEGADLIVMSTHGRSGLGRALLGSVAEAVAHHAPVPVLLVRAGHPVKDWGAVTG
ncbi:universal stress protein [Deinococcus sp. YIM 77859]|uniref:universal stress protein n=1 Tax=Deinococcus sp. YIM 77859 TaxID=1540221 RepID=UPI00054D875C|nr:universal stress protein [Deinococcus sp. YIM 77859]